MGTGANPFQVNVSTSLSVFFYQFLIALDTVLVPFMPGWRTSSQVRVDILSKNLIQGKEMALKAQNIHAVESH